MQTRLLIRKTSNQRDRELIIWSDTQCLDNLLKSNYPNKTLCCWFFQNKAE